MSDETTDPSKSSKENKSLSIGNLLQNAQAAISIIVGLTAMLTAGGYIVVNSYLEKFTQIQGYSITPGKYIAAGIGFLVVASLFGVPSLIWFLLGIRVLVRSEFLMIRRFDRRLTNDKFSRNVIRDLDFLKNLTHSWWFSLLVGIVYGVVLAGFIYGPLIYGEISHSIGGGKPVSVILVFKDVDTAPLFSLSIDPANNKRSAKVLLLAELTDGVLIADTITGHVAAIKADLIAGIIDTNIATNLITPTPMGTQSPTSTVTPTATTTP